MLSEMDLTRLESERQTIVDKIASLKAGLDIVNAEIEERVAPLVDQIRADTGKATGVVEAELDGCEVKHDAPKKVEWDQVGLKKLRGMIAEDGGNPDDFVTAKYSMAEKVFKSLSEEQRKDVAPYRMEKVGKAKITIKIMED